jgi:cysteine desulfurase
MKTRGSMLDAPYILAHLSAADSACPIRPDGSLDHDVMTDITSSIKILATLTVADAEYGLISDIWPTAMAIKAKNAENRIFVDLSQAAGRLRLTGIPEDFDYVSLDLSLLGGPPGLGALWARSREHLDAPSLWTGFGQQETRGTALNAATLRAGAVAVRQLLEDLDNEQAWMYDARHRLDEIILQEPGITLNFPESALLVNTSNYHVQGIDSKILVRALSANDLIVSDTVLELRETTMCSALTAFSFPEEERYSNVRFSVTRKQSPGHAENAAQRFLKTVREARKL